ncbi:YhgE/Pip domain-containing protein [Amnibacterium sp. CER49]|uniref:YhgE/Pip domain-containing protein n=1 Tax=Amnibacterium sp. CER49 TaxID=3039161 RepID=UPI002449A942|nr:YhgE/Pip domain-containing protein [Amnibacterium sp. CER49]MDH2443713.1 YhgE/Pip domain-containing protein [Amnibacterium sp. CER49]
MTVLTLLRSELRRLTATRLGVVAFVALMAVPLLYGGLYLWGNRDPYGALSHVPAGLVVADGGKTVDGRGVDYGRRVADRLERDGAFDWHELSAADAARELRTGGVDFVLTLPTGFSHDLASAATSSPTRARVELATNDANGYLAGTIASQAANAVRASVAQQVGSAAASRFLVALADVRSSLAAAASGAHTLATGTAKAASGAAALETGTGSLSGGAAQVAAGVGSADNGAREVATGAASAASGARTLSAGASSVASGAARVAGGLDALRSATADLPAQTAALADGAERTAAGARSIASGASAVGSGATAVAGSARDLATGASAAATGAGRVASGSSDLAAGLARIDAGSATTAAALSARLKGDGLTDVQVAQALAVLAPGAAAVHDAAASSTTLATGAQRVASGVGAVSTGASRLASGADGVASGAARVSSGASTLATGAGRVATGAATLDRAAPALASGIRTADDGARPVASGTARVAKGSADLASGTTTLSTGAGRVASGLDALRTGSASVAGGARQAASGARSLASGTASLRSGSATLATRLASGSSRIPATTADERSRQASAIGDPAAVARTKVIDAGTYGAGLAPFFLSLSTWIGSYALFLILRPLSRRALTAVRAPIRVALAGWLTPALLGAVQVLGLLAIVTLALGFSVAHPIGTLGVLVLTAGAFAAILLLLNAALGSVGQFLGLILMLVQLVTAGGTFPWQTLPGPLAAVHAVLPMSYAVDGLRQTMFGGDLARAAGDAGVLAIWLVAALALTTAVAARMTAHRTLRDLQPSLIGG